MTMPLRKPGNAFGKELILMNSVLNLQQLSERSLQQLTDVIGAQNARQLHDFLHRTQ